MTNPYKSRVNLFDRLMFPSLEAAWDQGFEAGRKDAANRAPKPVKEPEPNVVHRPGEDNGFYIVQSEETVLTYFDGRSATRWVNIAAFPDAELAEAEAKADAVYQEHNGATQVRVVHVGKEVTT